MDLVEGKSLPLQGLFFYLHSLSGDDSEAFFNGDGESIEERKKA